MYDYEKEKKMFSTDRGLRMFIELRDSIKRKLKQTGAITLEKAIDIADTNIGAATNWELMACVDKMVEMGELERIFDHTISNLNVYVPTSSFRTELENN